MASNVFIPAPDGWRIRWTHDDPDENPVWDTQPLIGWNTHGNPLVAETGEVARLDVPHGTWFIAGPGQPLPGEDGGPAFAVL